jgi:hypothetical protein
MRGSAPERSRGQGVPRVNRTVQTRVVLDAIVSTKTFGNATSAPPCSQTISCNFLCRFCGTFRIFEQYLLLVCFTQNDKRAKDEQISANPYLCPLLLAHRQECDARTNGEVQTFFHNIFDRDICQTRGRGILEVSSVALIAAESTLFRVAPASRGRCTPLGRGPTGRTPHC